LASSEGEPKSQRTVIQHDTFPASFLRLVRVRLGNVPGRPMSDQEISDVVAWLSSQRPAVSGDIEAANVVRGGGR